jgi:two-component system CheB/CheR fusion protein
MAARKRTRTRNVARAPKVPPEQPETPLEEPPPSAEPPRSEGGATKPGCPIVGIGASAGGLEAFKKFFATMPADSGIAFVLIPHLDPTHESLMPELLAHHTSMPVVEATEGTAVEPGHVYIIPPDRYLTIRGGILRLTGPVERHSPQTAIDLFLRSLADDQQEKAICIILSGTGAHGTLGLKAVKASGGMAMVQDPATASYDRMPQSAIATGLADFVLAPEQMPQALLEYVRHFYVNGGRPAEAVVEAPDELGQVLALLRARTQYDFRSYRKKMLARRIERRMGINHIEQTADYLAFLREHPNEVKQLVKDMLISVTSFFRDPEAFEALKTEVIAPLVQTKGADAPLRVWVPGCATGEEAYSLAILLLEQLAAAQKSCPVQIFATDIDKDALEVARLGIYPESIVADISPKRLARFFVRTDEAAYQVNKALREAVLFAVQNLILDPPFSKLDLISCRNVLIYFEPELQRKVLTLLHFALHPEGYLFLGPSETVGRPADQFEPVSRKWRIYRRIGPSHPERMEFPVLPLGEPHEGAGQLPGPVARRPVHLGDLTHRLLLEDYAVAAVLVNQSFEVLYFHGPTVRYLEQPSGEPTRDLLALAREGLRTRLRSALHQAAREHQRVTARNVRLRRDGAYHLVRLTVKPVETVRAPEGLLLVIFEDEPEGGSESPPVAAEAPPAGGEPAEESLIRHLEYELQATKEDLQSTIEELETSNEELKATNEEMMSMNEELQSANEELETSKEELQSLNEELNTVNSQLQDKTEELTRAYNDLTNVLDNTGVATVFLDTQLRVKRFTPASTQLFSLIAADIGRPLTDISWQFEDDTLVSHARQVLRDLTPLDREVQATGGHWYVRRAVPYRTADNRIEGVALSFTDVTGLKQAGQAIERLAAMVESSDDAIIGKTPDGTITSWNPGAKRIYGYSSKEVVGQSIFLLVPPDRTEEVRQTLHKIRQGQPVGPFKTRHIRKDGREIVVSVCISPVKDAAGNVIGASGIARDLTEQERLEDMVRLQGAIAANMAEGVGVVRASDAVLVYTNEKYETMFGYGPGELLGKPVSVLNAPGEKTPEETARAIIDTLNETGVWRGEVHNVRKDGTTFWSLATVSTLEHPEFGTVWVGVQSDITERKEMEDMLREGRERLAAIVNTADDAIITIDEGGAIESVNPAAETMFGYRAGEMVGQNVKMLMPSPYREEHDTYLANYLRTGVKKLIGIGREVRGRRKDGSTFPLDLAVSEFHDSTRRMFTGILRDISGRKALEREVLEVSALEQRRIGQDLHDTVGQELTGLAMMAETLAEAFREHSPADAPDAARIAEGLKRALGQVRALSRGLIPVEVDAHGLMAALADLARRTSGQGGVACTFRCDEPVRVEDTATATHLFRIAQEALSNALRHSRARHVEVRLRSDGPVLTLSVCDDGVGLPPRPARTQGLGIRIMRYRAGLIGAALDVGPAPGCGTLVTCSLTRGDRHEAQGRQGPDRR